MYNFLNLFETALQSIVIFISDFRFYLKTDIMKTQKHQHKCCPVSNFYSCYHIFTKLAENVMDCVVEIITRSYSIIRQTCACVPKSPKFVSKVHFDFGIPLHYSNR